MNTYQRLLRCFLIVILVILPLQYLWIIPIEQSARYSINTFFLTNWYELIIILALPVITWQLMSKRKQFLWFEWALVTVLLFAVASSLWSLPELKTDLIGLRYGVGFIAFYLASRVIPISRTVLDLTLRITLTISIILAFVQIALWSYSGSFQWGFMVIRDYAGELPRVYGSFIGPNQLATYVMVVSLYLFSNKKISVWLFICSAIVVIATFSRSALLGTLAGALIVLWQNRLNLTKYKVFLLVAVPCILLITLNIINSDAVGNTLLYSRNTPERLQALEGAFQRFQSAPLITKLAGHGITTAGPSTFSTGQIFIPENWYLQVLHELGLIGLATILITITALVKHLLRSGNAAALPVVVALAINSLFLHPLADNPTAALTVFTILGVMMTNSSNLGKVNS